MKRFHAMNAYLDKLPNGHTVFLSYATPVAIIANGGGSIAYTDKKFSRTTSKQLTKFLKELDKGGIAVKVTNDAFKGYLSNIKYDGSMGWL